MQIWNSTTNQLEMYDGTMWGAAGGTVSSQGQTEASPVLTSAFKAPNNQFTTTAPNTRLIETGNGNVLVNPSFEGTNASDGWTVSSGTASDETTNFLDGLKSLKLTLAASTGQIVFQDVPTVGQVVGKNWEYTISLKTSVASQNICARAASAIISGSCQAVIPDSEWHEYTFNYPANQTSNGIELDSGVSATGDVYLDKAYVGFARNIGTVQQAVFLGKVTVSGCGAQFDSSSTSFVNFTPGSGCTTTATDSLTSAGSGVLGFTIPSLAPGLLKMEAIGFMGANNTSLTSLFRFSDGTNASTEEPAAFSGSAAVSISQATGTIKYATAQSNLTINLQSKVDSGGQAFVNADSSYPFSFNVYYYPTTAQQVANVNSGPFFTDPVPYTPTYAGLGLVTPVNSGVTYARDGQNMVYVL